MNKRIAKNKSTPLRIKEIPPPPGREASWDEKAAYYEKYDWGDLEKAGYLRPLTKKEKAEHDRLGEAIRRSILMQRRKAS